MMIGKMFILALMITTAGCSSRTEVAAPASHDIMVVLSPKRMRVGDTPRIDVRIRNLRKTSAWLVPALDGSTDGMRSPLVDLAIRGPGLADRPVVRCGNMNPMNSGLVIEVPPGAELDPFAQGWLPYRIATQKFTVPGRYTAVFHYSSLERDPRKWAGDGHVGKELTDAIAHVTPIELRDSVTFTVLP